LFSLRQSEAGLLLQKETRRDRSSSEKTHFFITDLLRSNQPRFLTVTSGSVGTTIYLNGTLAATAPDFRLSPNDLSGRLILGDSPWQTDSWAGEFLGLALYRRRLTAAEVIQNYTAWRENGQPTERSNLATLYYFDERSGAIVHDQSGSHDDLYIPPRYEVIDQFFLEPVWSEFGMTRSYWSAALKNIVGLVPFGFCFFAYLATRFPSRRAAILTVVLGTTVSLTIEILQWYLPTRDSGSTDIITNTLGTWIGVVFYRVLARSFSSRLPSAELSSNVRV
jgi:VanZ family protein